MPCWTIHQADEPLHALRPWSAVQSPAEPCCLWGWDLGTHPHPIASFRMRVCTGGV